MGRAWDSNPQVLADNGYQDRKIASSQGNDSSLHAQMAKVFPFCPFSSLDSWRKRMATEWQFLRPPPLIID